MPELESAAAAVPTLLAQEFRAGMSRLGAGVCIVTSDGPQGRVGFTASAVCSVSDKPPTLLVCLQHGSSAYAAVIGNQVLCVNTLGRGGEALSRLFGGKTPVDERFATEPWTTLATGAPVLVQAPIAFDCRITRAVPVSTHDVLLCEVMAIHAGDLGRGGLVYFDRNYHLVGCEAERPMAA